MENTARTVAIIRCLLGSGNATAGTIAKELNISSKTVSRELPKVEHVLESHGLALLRKTGTGLRIEGPADEIEKLRQDVMETHVEMFTPQQRQIILAGQLLQSTEPIKLFTLASILRVTDGTVSHDLDKLEIWFQKHRLLLVRRPGLGAYVKGDEKDIRRALIELIYDNLDEEQLLSLVHDNMKGDEEKGSAAERYLLHLVDAQIVHQLERLVHVMESKLPHHLSDNAFIGLVVHLSLSVQRMKKCEDIHIDGQKLKILQSHREYEVAAEIARRMEMLFSIKVPKDEIGYITMHLLGARSLYQNEGDSAASMVDNFQLVRLAQAIIRKAESETGKVLKGNQDLLVGLVNHLGPSISRLRMHMDIRNPLLKEMRTAYPDFMDLARKAVAPLEEELGEKLPEAEIAYIAMHLGAALADENPERRTKVHVVVTCPTGMGTSRMLASRIKQSYKNIRVVDQISVLRITESYLAAHHIDFIISTVPIPHLPIPVVVTTPLLDAADKGRIDAELERRLNVPVPQISQAPEQKTVSFPEGLRQMAAYNQAIQELLQSFFDAVVEEPNLSIAEICQQAARRISREPAVQERIMTALLVRETKGETILRGNAMILLHARTEAVASLHFGILHLGHPLRYPERDGELVKTVMVMLAPENCSRQALETVGVISASLLERWGLMEILHEGSRQAIYQELIHMFKGFYQKKYREYLGEN